MERNLRPNDIQTDTIYSHNAFKKVQHITNTSKNEQNNNNDVLEKYRDKSIYEHITDIIISNAIK